jgi:CheY-like chemotaxis protein
MTLLKRHGSRLTSALAARGAATSDRLCDAAHCSITADAPTARVVARSRNVTFALLGGLEVSEHSEVFAAPGDGTSRSVTICLAEDNEVVRGHIADILSAHGHRVVAAVGIVADAEQAVVNHLPDLAVIAGRLPDGSGIELCARLRDTAPEVPLILYTATISWEDRQTALRLDCRGRPQERADGRTARCRQAGWKGPPSGSGHWHSG